MKQILLTRNGVYDARRYNYFVEENEMLEYHRVLNKLKRAIQTVSTQSLKIRYNLWRFLLPLHLGLLPFYLASDLRVRRCPDSLSPAHASPLRVFFMDVTCWPDVSSSPPPQQQQQAEANQNVGRSNCPEQGPRATALTTATVAAAVTSSEEMVIGRRTHGPCEQAGYHREWRLLCPSQG